MTALPCDNRIVFCFLAALAASIATDLRAQGTEDAAGDIETIEVIGSRIADIDVSGIAPVFVMDRQQIERTGAISIADVLQQLPFDNAGTFNDRQALSSAIGAAGISMRGLGANSVLVLVNGRRATTHSFPYYSDAGSLVSFVDLNTIPPSAVERIEILKDGASALYGSDAMAGVINIVLRENFSGAEVLARFGAAREGDAEEQAFSALWGWVGSRTSVELLASYTKREPLTWRSRAVSASANHEDRGGIDLRSIDASNFLIGSSIGSFGADCENRTTAAGDSAFESFDDWICLYNPNADIIVPSVERWSAMALVAHEIRPDLLLRLEASYLGSEAQGRLDSSSTSLAMFPAGNPWNPFGVDALGHYRFTETGPRIDTIDTENTRLVVALEGTGERWNWDIGVVYHRAVTSDLGQGYLSGERIEEALNGVDLNGDGVLQEEEYWNLYSPASNPNDPALVDTLLVSKYREAETELYSLDAKIYGPVLELPAGEVSMAVGIEARSEALTDESDPLTSGALLDALTYPQHWWGLRVDVPYAEIDPFAYIDPWDVQFQVIEPIGFPDSEGERAVASTYTEFLVPVHARLDVQTALRYEVYEDLGPEWVPKLGFRFKTLPRLLTRASWGKGIRLPSLAELYLGPSAESQATWDPQRCPEPFTLPHVSACVVTNFATITSGNEDLEPEHSESFSVGFEFELSGNTDAEADCWQIEVENKIVALGVERILRYEESLDPEFVIRGPNVPFDNIFNPPGWPPISGPIERINNQYQNLARQVVRGCDYQVATTAESNRLGTLHAQLVGTHMASNEVTFLQGLPAEELAGSFGYPRNRINVNLSWRYSDWDAGVYGRWTDGFRDTYADGEVASHAEWDTQLSYSGFDRLRLTLGIENVLNEEPPFSAGYLNPQGFPAQYYDMRGRFFYGQVQLTMGAATRSR